MIDGSTQPGFAGEPLVMIDGASAPSGASALVIQGGASTVQALIIGGFQDGDGVVLEVGGGNRVLGCRIGTDRSGLIPRPNWHGITIRSAGNTIGGTTDADRNIVSGNNSPGHRGDTVAIQILGAAAADNVVVGNYLGVGPDGVTPVVNGLGVGVSGAPRPVIGGTAPGAGNLISGNEYNGVRLVGAGVTGAIVQGNVIGLDAAGAPLGNATDAGIRIKKIRDATIGGSAPGAGNVISANLYGIRITERASAIRILGNRIGTDASGTLARGNVLEGILTTASPSITIGGEASGEANVIAFNGRAGVAVVSGSPVKVSGNAMTRNGGLGIDLGTTGVTPNDAGDADIGANGLQNFPVVTSVTRVASTTSVTVTLSSIASKTYRLQLFVSDQCDPSGYGEGARFLGAASVTTSTSGQVSATLTVGPVSVGEVITATATDPAGSTSEFSACQTVA
ncbi:MAG: hypothetical protein LC722_07555 [Actinobacteria bacterium]|nr:hypothetical protein [Actinomycetota bacterium]